jgi:hypothetical protein
MGSRLGAEWKVRCVVRRVTGVRFGKRVVLDVLFLLEEEGAVFGDDFLSVKPLLFLVW